MAQTRLKQLRDEAVLTVHELAQKSGVSDDTITKIENGQRVARPSTLRKLARALEVSPQELRKPAQVEELAGAGKAEAPREAGQPSAADAAEEAGFIEGVAAAVDSVADRTQKRREQTDETDADALTALLEDSWLAHRGAEQLLEDVNEAAAQKQRETPAERRARAKLEHAVMRLTDLAEVIASGLLEGVLEGAEEGAILYQWDEERRRRRAG